MVVGNQNGNQLYYSSNRMKLGFSVNFMLSDDFEKRDVFMLKKYLSSGEFYLLFSDMLKVNNGDLNIAFIRFKGVKRRTKLAKNGTISLQWSCDVITPASLKVKDVIKQFRRALRIKQDDSWSYHSKSYNVTHFFNTLSVKMLVQNKENDVLNV